MTSQRRQIGDQVFPEGPPKGRYHSVSIAHEHGSLSVRYKRNRWGLVCPDDGKVRSRDTCGLICLEGEHVGSFMITEFRGPLFVAREEFLEEMDSHSQANAELAMALLTHWEEPADFFHNGEIVELRRLWIKPQASGRGRLRAVLRRVLSELYHQRSLLILKAFPLEFEGDVHDTNRPAFQSRQQAMMRHYSHLLGVSTLPGSGGEAGWMYEFPDRLPQCFDLPSLDCWD